MNGFSFTPSAEPRNHCAPSQCEAPPLSRRIPRHHEPHSQSGDKSRAVQTPRADRTPACGAKRLDCGRLRRRFPDLRSGFATDRDSKATERARLTPTRRAFLPLPKGEGRGEGERRDGLFSELRSTAVRNSPALPAARCCRMSHGKAPHGIHTASTNERNRPPPGQNDSHATNKPSLAAHSAACQTRANQYHPSASNSAVVRSHRRRNRRRGTILSHRHTHRPVE